MLRRRGSDVFVKRAFDCCASFAGLVLLSPVLVVLYMLVRAKMGSPVFFCQRRPGLGGKPFRIIKFRTLTNARDEGGNLLPENNRITRLGKLMRKASLDELPELFNVLKGDMSLVGPRPLTMYYLPLYNQGQARRHEVRPGITGWAQANGRSTLTWEEKFALDVWYVDNRTLWLDVKILAMTIWQVFKRADTTPRDGEFTRPFRGTGDKMISEKELQRLKKEENSKWL